MARTTKGYGIKDDARRSHLSLGDGEWAEIYYEGLTGLDAVRKGRQIRKFISATKLPDITAFVSTNASIYFDVGSTTASRVFVSDLIVGLHSIQDNVQVEVGYTATAAGVGTFTALTPKFDYYTAAQTSGLGQTPYHFEPPLVARYTADSAKSVTLRFNANDTSAEVNAGWYGWYEAE